MSFAQLPVLEPGPPPLRRPPWLKVRLPGGGFD